MAEKNKQSSTFSCKIITFVSTFYEIKPRKYGGLDKKLNSALLYVSQKSLHTLVKLHHKTDGAIWKFSYRTLTQQTQRKTHIHCTDWLMMRHFGLLQWKTFSVTGRSSDPARPREYRGWWGRQGRYAKSKLQKTASFTEVKSLNVYRSTRTHILLAALILPKWSRG